MLAYSVRAQEFFQIIQTRAFCLAHIEARCRDAKLQARGKITAQHAADAKTGVEMISRAGGYLWLCGKRADYVRRAVCICGGGEAGGMNNHGFNPKLLADERGVLGDAGMRVIDKPQFEHLADLPAFL